MKKSALLSLMLLTALIIRAQDKPIEDPNASLRQVGAFHAIRVEDGVDVYLTQSSSQAVAVSATSRSNTERILTVVENGVLHIYTRERSLGWRDRHLRAYISCTDLDMLHASGGSDVIVKGELKSEKLSIRLSGGSDFVGNVRAGTLKVDQSGGGDVRIQGIAVNLEVGASGGSDFKGYELACEYVVARAGGGSDIQVSVSKEIYAEASGGSDVYYRGDPKVQHVSSSGGSSVSKRG